MRRLIIAALVAAGLCAVPSTATAADSCVSHADYSENISGWLAASVSQSWGTSGKQLGGLATINGYLYAVREYHTCNHPNQYLVLVQYRYNASNGRWYEQTKNQSAW